MSDPVFQLQADVHARLSADAYFADVLVLLNEKGILIDDVDSAVKLFTAKAGKKGAAVIVDRPFREVTEPNGSGPRFGVTIPVSVFEMPLINRATGGSGKTIEAITSKIMHLMHGWSANTQLAQIYMDKDAVTPVVGNDKVIVTEIQLRSTMQFAAPARVARPTFSGNASALSIGCNTTAATIYYTTNGSFPWSGNTAATKYGLTITTEDGTVIVTENGDPLITPGPFSVSTGTTVRAAAFADNYQGSDAATITL
jgi:hypothetical protein